MESYCGDYGQYFPCSPAWGGRRDVIHDPWPSWYTYGSEDAGIYTDPKLNQSVQTGMWLWDNAGPQQMDQAYVGCHNAMGFRTIYQSLSLSNPMYPTPGQLVFAPNGLGYLIDGGYLGDVRTFFCPSTGGELAGFDTQPAYGGLPYPSLINISSLSRLQQAGGFDKDACSHGDWSSLIYNWRNDPIFYASIQGTYNYRNVPSALAVDGAPKLDLSGAPWRPNWGAPYTPADYPEGNDYQVQLPYTSPKVKVSLGGAVFKTQKILGSRAIVTDSFSRVSKDCTGVVPPGPGDGYHTHRDGYNVLYGDWSAQWYGDPQERIMWWPWEWGTNGGRVALRALQINVLNWIEYLDGTAGYTVAPNWSDQINMDYYRADMIWHELDVFHGVDVAAKGTVAP